MTNISFDISGKLDPHFVTVIENVQMVCTTIDVELLLIGAMARDILFQHAHGISTGRMTADIDFAILVEDWNTFNRVLEQFRQNEQYKNSVRAQHRFTNNNGVLFDIIPFGDIEHPPGQIHWQPHFNSVMSTVGFRDAYDGALICRLRTDPRLEIRIVSIPGLAALKLLSWENGYPKRKKDAIDLRFIMEYYIDAGQHNRLYDEENDLIETPDFDYERTSAQLLGRDVSRIISPDTQKHLVNILDEELKTDGQCRLIVDASRSIEQDTDRFTGLLQAFLRGINDKEPI